MTTDLLVSDLLSASLATLAGEEARIAEARAEVRRLEALLEAAKQDERAASGHMMGGRRASRRRGLLAVEAALAAGSAGILVRGYRDSAPLPGAVLKVTAARAVVLTEVGELEFDLKPRGAFARPGEGRGEARIYSIDVADLA